MKKTQFISLLLIIAIPLVGLVNLIINDSYYIRAQAVLMAAVIIWNFLLTKDN